MASLFRMFWLRALIVIALLGVFVLATQRLKLTPRQSVGIEMQVALPLFVQVAMAAGDRHLAANMGAVRAQWVDNFKMSPADFKTLAKVQEDVSWLNPGHEDNYHLAAAILAWSGQTAPAQRILARAALVRPFDFQPPFFYGFNQLHFFGDYAGAARTMQKAAERMPDPDTRLNMQNVAARWADKTDDPDFAIRVVERMAEQATRRDFKRYLQVRILRLKMLKFLRAAARNYYELKGRRATAPEDLVNAGIISELPSDPLGYGFAINAAGEVVLSTSLTVKQK